MNEFEPFVHPFEKEINEIDHHINELNRQKQEMEKKIREQYREQEVWEEKINQDFRVYMETYMKDIYQVKEAKYWGKDERVKMNLIHDTHDMQVNISVHREKGEFHQYQVLFTICMKPEEKSESIPYAVLKEKINDFLRTELEKYPETRLIALTTENWSIIRAEMVVEWL